MKQKVVARAIIRDTDKVLLLRRRGGRPSIAGLYELPTGKLHYRQQPEDALRNGLSVHVGVAPQTIQLRDVMSFIDPDDRALQYVFVMYNVSLKPSNKTIKLSSEYDKYVWKKVSELQPHELTNSTQIQLGLTTHSHKTDLAMQPREENVDSNTTYYHVIIHTDGGSRGNPGPSATGYVILDTTKKVVDQGGAYLGVTTNNQAEYLAVVQALERAEELGTRIVDFRIDSQLVVNQMNGSYKVKNRELLPIYERILKLSHEFEKVSFTHVRREYNKLADGIVNKILDSEVAKTV